MGTNTANNSLERRDFLKSVAAGSVALTLPQEILGARPETEKPNIVVIFADDMGYGDLSCQSVDSKIHTPNMDQLAAEGMRFTDAHSASAVCTPSRYALLTGRYSWRSRLKRKTLGGFDPPLIEPHRMTVASLLKKHGYTTACFGKWHLGLGWRTKDGKVAPWGLGEPIKEAAPRIDYKRPIVDGVNVKGFDYFYGISGPLDSSPYTYIENDRVVSVPTEWTTPTKNPLPQDTDFPFISLDGTWDPGPIAPGFSFVETLPDLTNRVVKYIDEHARKSEKTPFFLYFAVTAPHDPIVPAKFVRGSSAAGPYGDFIVEVDWSVGEVMKALERNAISEKTLIIVTSDNGSPGRSGIGTKPYSIMEVYHHLPNGNLKGIKADIWDGGHREPFIARWPGKIPAGTVNNETICLSDIMNTCAAIVGDKLPPDAGEDSYNILPYLLGQHTKTPIRDATVHHSCMGMFALRQGPWKVVFGGGGGGWTPCAYLDHTRPDDPWGQLYNMDSDVEERVNLYNRRREIVKRLWEVWQQIHFQGHSRPGLARS